MVTPTNLEELGFQKWPKIGQLKNTLYYFNSISEFADFNVIIEYAPKPKLHGTNAAIRFYMDDVEDEQVAISMVAQSRNRDIHVGDDNYGFASWVNDNNDEFLHNMRLHRDAYCTTVFGEWAGQGILGGAAICQAPRGFHVYAIQMQDHAGNIIGMEIEPENIEHILQDVLDAMDDVHVLPWIGKNIAINAGDTALNDQEVAHINGMMEMAGKHCSYTHKLYGIDGPLEGFVYYPRIFTWVGGEYMPLLDVREKVGEREWLKMMTFKVKSETFRDTKSSKQAIEMDPEELKSITEFVDKFVTEPRLLQGLEETKAETLKDTGDFIAWVCKDVFEESELEREKMEIAWKPISSRIAKKASQWYRDRL